MPEKRSDHLVLEGLEKRFVRGGGAAVEALSLTVAEGELIGLLGPSGCGKTTTLRMIAGLTTVSAGRVRVRGQDVTDLLPHLRDMGVVFQNYALFPHMSVADNLAFGLEMRRISRPEIVRRVRRALGMVQLSGHADRYPRQLSGGQQQRVALARALVIEPSMLLLDEPLSNLDAHLREQLRAEIRDIQQSQGITALFVTHDQAEALALCDRIAVMRAGRLEQMGTPQEIYERPASAFVASFVGRVNQLEAVRGVDGTIRSGPVVLARGARGNAARARVTVMIRPHRLTLRRAGGATVGGSATENKLCTSGRIRRVTFGGDTTLCEVDIGSTTMLVEHHTHRAQCAWSRGEAVQLSWQEDDVLVFPREPST